jgi:hypothetical protein
MDVFRAFYTSAASRHAPRCTAITNTRADLASSSGRKSWANLAVHSTDLNGLADYNAAARFCSDTLDTKAAPRSQAKHKQPPEQAADQS